MTAAATAVQLPIGYLQPMEKQEASVRRVRLTVNDRYLVRMLLTNWLRVCRSNANDPVVVPAARREWQVELDRADALYRKLEP